MSPAQKRLLDEIKAGQQVVRSFDVGGGWWYWLRPTQTKIRAATVDNLVKRGVLICGEEKRIYSGYREAIFTLAEGQP